MNKPNLYLQQENEIIKRSKYFFDKYFDLVRETETKTKVLDIGSGPGNVTHDILYRYFKEDIDEVVGFDKSKSMVQYANTFYQNEKFLFKELDIMHGPDLEEFREHFDYVFSLWALHWIPDQRSLFANIYEIMKSDGDLLLTYVAKSELFEVYRTVWHKPIYHRYIKDFTGMESSFQSSKNPIKELRSILKGVGFEVCLCELSKWRVFYPEDIKTFLIAINPAYDQLPEHLREDFIADHVKEMNKRNRFNFEGKFIIDYEMFVVYARKNNVNRRSYFKVLLN